MIEKKPPLCKCGCGELTKWSKYKKTWNKFITGHGKREKSTKKNRTPEEIQTLKNQNPPLCGCGCGGLTKWNKDKNVWNEYLHGHFNIKAIYSSRTPEEIQAEYDQGPPLCECGCGGLTKWYKRQKVWRRYVHGHAIGRMTPEEIQALKNQKPPLCGCGCGGLTKWAYHGRKGIRWNKFIKGHQHKYKKHTKEHKKKMKEAWERRRVEQPMKEETKQKIGQANSGKIGFWKGGISYRSKNKYPNSPVNQYAKQFNMSFEEAAQEFRELYNDGVESIQQQINKIGDLK